MKKSILLFLSFGVISSIIAGPKKPTSLKIDSKATIVKWEAKKVTGKHNGTINVSSGNLNVSKATLVSGKVEMDMNSIHDTDLQGEYAGKLEGHLKSDDFFNTAKYPTATLNITSVTPGTTGKNMVTGDLTIKGVTKQITFPALLNIAKKKVNGTASFKIDRTQFGIKYGSSSFIENLGDKAIDNEFTLDIVLSTK